MSTEAVDPIRLLVVARHPLRLDDLELDDLPDVEEVQLIRRPAALDVAFEELDPNVVLMDVNFPEGRSFPAIDRARALAPDVRILALTPDPPSHDAVARALRAGASGFVDINATPRESVEAVRSVHAGEPWLPPDETRAILGSVAEDLDVTAAERRSRLTGVVIALIPLAAAMAAIMSLYLGGNADLYVLVDPCDEDTVEFVSVGSTRLVVIDEVVCAPAGAG
jgi:DNA-binding NarL/FixJ family response regulator